MKDSPLVQLAYLRSTGRDVEFTYKNKTTPYGLSQYKPFLDELVEFEFPEGALDQQDIRKLSDIVLRNIEGFVKQRAEEPSGKVLIKTIYGGKQSKFESKIRFRLTESGDEGRVVPERDIQKLRDLRKELISPVQEMDYNAFHDKVNAASKGDHGLIAQWVTKQISHAFHSPYFNSEDRFANTIKKSYTAKNIVKEMNKEGANSDTIGMQSAGAVRAATARKLNNVASIKSAAGYLDNPENNKDSHDSLDDRLFELTSEIFKLNPNSTNYTEQTIINEVIVEYAATKNIASLQSLSYLKDLSPNDAIVKKVDQFIADVSASKTDYFEVKPKRVVEFSEFDTAIIPTIANPKAKQFLIDAGLNIIEYDYDNDNGRKEVLLTVAKDLATTIEYDSNELTP
jgi:hypothetical protein